MSRQSKHTTATLIPSLAYRDVAAAIDWLCRAFGFDCRRVFRDAEAGITHAQLTFGRGMLLVAPASDPAIGGRLRQPDASGTSSQALYVIVNSADALYTQAKAAGARVVVELKDEDYGGRGFSCLDPEGHLWSFGTYDPWADPAPEPPQPG